MYRGVQARCYKAFVMSLGDAGRSSSAAGVQLLERTIPRRGFVDPRAHEVVGSVKVGNADFGDLGRAWVVRGVHKAWRFDERLPG